MSASIDEVFLYPAIRRKAILARLNLRSPEDVWIRDASPAETGVTPGLYKTENAGAFRAKIRTAERLRAFLETEFPQSAYSAVSVTVGGTDVPFTWRGGGGGPLGTLSFAGLTVTGTPKKLTVSGIAGKTRTLIKSSPDGQLLATIVGEVKAVVRYVSLPGENADIFAALDLYAAPDYTETEVLRASGKDGAGLMAEIRVNSEAPGGTLTTAVILPDGRILVLDHVHDGVPPGTPPPFVGCTSPNGGCGGWRARITRIGDTPDDIAAATIERISQKPGSLPTHIITEFTIAEAADAGTISIVYKAPRSGPLSEWIGDFLPERTRAPVRRFFAKLFGTANHPGGVTISSVYALTHEELADFLSVPASNESTASLRLRILDAHADVSDRETAWIVGHNSFNTAIMIAVSPEDLMGALSPRAEILSRFSDRRAAVSADARVRAELRAAEKIIASYRGGWSEGEIERALGRARGGKAAERIVDDVLRRRTGAPADAPVLADELPPRVLPADRVAALAARGFRTAADLESNQAGARLTVEERVRVAHRATIFDLIPYAEIKDVWTPLFTRIFAGARPEALDAATGVRPVIRWTIANAWDPGSGDDRAVRVYVLSDAADVRGSGMFAPPTVKTIRAALGGAVRGEIASDAHPDATSETLVVRLSPSAPARAVEIRAIALTSRWIPFLAEHIAAFRAAPGAADMRGAAASADVATDSFSTSTPGARVGAATSAAAHGIVEEYTPPPGSAGRLLQLVPIARMTAVKVPEFAPAPASPAPAPASPAPAPRSKYFAAEKKVAATGATGATGAVEYEARFRDITRSMFFHVIDALAGRVAKTRYSESDVYLFGKSDNRLILDRTGGAKPVSMEKRTLFAEDSPDYGLRFSVSTETRAASRLREGSATARRERKRWSFDFGEVMVDCTQVVFWKIVREPSEERMMYSSFEVEAEVSAASSLPALNSVLNTVVIHSVYATPFLYTIDTRNGVLDDLNAMLSSPVSTPEAARAVFPSASREMSVVTARPTGDARNLHARDVVAAGLGSGYTVSPKADGFTAMLFVHVTGLWSIWKPASAALLIPEPSVADPAAFAELDGAVILVEHIPRENQSPRTNSNYLAVPFDTLAVPIAARKPVWDYVSRSRAAVDLAKRLERAVGNEAVLTFRYKDIIPVGDTVESLANALDQARRSEKAFAEDGVIFTPINTPPNPWAGGKRVPPLRERVLSAYPDICKLKPWNQLTIDFAVSISERTVYTIRRGRDGESELVPFSGTDAHPFDPETNVLWESCFWTASAALSGYTIPDGAIVEFGPVAPGDAPPPPSDGAAVTPDVVLEPRRIRLDKPAPNGDDIAADVWADLADPLSVDTLSGTNFKLLFRHFNAVKRQIFRDLGAGPRDFLVDLGSGRGGDLSKAAPDFSRSRGALFVEPDEANLGELTRRLRAIPDLAARADVLAARAQETERIVEAFTIAATRRGTGAATRGGTVFITMMLSLSFFWETAEELSMLGRTLSAIADASRAAGFARTEFVYMTIEGAATRNFLDTSGGDAVSVGPVHIRRLAKQLRINRNPARRRRDGIWIEIKGTIVRGQEEFFVDIVDLTPWVAFSTPPRPVLSGGEFLSAPERIYGGLFVHGRGVVASGAEAALSTTELSTESRYPYLRHRLPPPAVGIDRLAKSVAGGKVDVLSTVEDGAETVVILRGEDALAEDGVSLHFNEGARFSERIYIWDTVQSKISATASYDEARTALSAAEPLSGDKYNWSMPRVSNPAAIALIMRQTLDDISHRSGRKNLNLHIVDTAAIWGDGLVAAIAAGGDSYTAYNVMPEANLPAMVDVLARKMKTTLHAGGILNGPQPEANANFALTHSSTPEDVVAAANAVADIGGCVAIFEHENTISNKTVLESMRFKLHTSVWTLDPAAVRDGSVDTAVRTARTRGFLISVWVR